MQIIKENFEIAMCDNKMPLAFCKIIKTMTDHFTEDARKLKMNEGI